MKKTWILGLLVFSQLSGSVLAASDVAEKEKSLYLLSDEILAAEKEKLEKEKAAGREIFLYPKIEGKKE